MSYIEWIALIAAGILAGWVNTLAGGGSMLTVPALMFFGLPADIANASNRVAVVAQSAVGAAGYQAAGRLDARIARRVIPLTLLGAAAGAYLATWLDNAIFRPVMLCTMLTMAVLLVAKPRFLSPVAAETPPSPPWLASLSLLGCGFYGGFLQAGVGLILIATLVGLLRQDLVRANALKLLVVLAFTLVSVAVFVWRGRVAWGPALALSVGSMLGARLGVRFALTRGTAAIRHVVFVTVVASCGYLLFVH